MNQDEMKQAVADAALAYIQPKLENDTVLGIGTGSTANLFIDALARIKGQINATVASSEASAQRLKSHGIPVYELNTVDRVDFMRWPSGAVLSRPSVGKSGSFRYCQNQTPGAEDACNPLPGREVGDRLRHLRTEEDFAALAAGATTVGIAPVKFLVDQQAGDVVHLLGAERWPLHYTFAREVIGGEPPLDRCDPDQNALFEAGSYAFAASEYYNTVGRRYLLGTLAHHVGADVYAVEFTSGDLISAQQMKKAFFAVTNHVLEPERWFLHPTDD